MEDLINNKTDSNKNPSEGDNTLAQQDHGSTRKIIGQCVQEKMEKIVDDKVDNSKVKACASQSKAEKIEGGQNFRDNKLKPKICGVPKRGKRTSQESSSLQVKKLKLSGSGHRRMWKLVESGMSYTTARNIEMSRKLDKLEKKSLARKTSDNAHVVAAEKAGGYKNEDLADRNSGKYIGEVKADEISKSTPDRTDSDPTKFVTIQGDDGGMLTFRRSVDVRVKSIVETGVPYKTALSREVANYLLDQALKKPKRAHKTLYFGFKAKNRLKRYLLLGFPTKIAIGKALRPRRYSGIRNDAFLAERQETIKNAPSFEEIINNPLKFLKRDETLGLSNERLTVRNLRTSREKGASNYSFHSKKPSHFESSYENRSRTVDVSDTSTRSFRRKMTFSSTDTRRSRSEKLPVSKSARDHKDQGRHSYLKSLHHVDRTRERERSRMYYEGNPYALSKKNAHDLRKTSSKYERPQASREKVSSNCSFHSEESNHFELSYERGARTADVSNTSTRIGRKMPIFAIDNRSSCPKKRPVSEPVFRKDQDSRSYLDSLHHVDSTHELERHRMYYEDNPYALSEKNAHELRKTSSNYNRPFHPTDKDRIYCVLQNAQEDARTRHWLPEPVRDRKDQGCRSYLDSLHHVDSTHELESSRMYYEDNPYALSESNTDDLKKTSSNYNRPFHPTDRDRIHCVLQNAQEDALRTSSEQINPSYLTSFQYLQHVDTTLVLESERMYHKEASDFVSDERTPNQIASAPNYDQRYSPVPQWNPNEEITKSSFNIRSSNPERLSREESALINHCNEFTWRQRYETSEQILPYYSNQDQILHKVESSESSTGSPHPVDSLEPYAAEYYNNPYARNNETGTSLTYAATGSSQNRKSSYRTYSSKESLQQSPSPTQNAGSAYPHKEPLRKEARKHSVESQVIKVGLLHFDHPHTQLSSEQLADLEGAIMDAFDDIPENGPQVRFLACSQERGYLHLECADSVTLNWLDSILYGLRLRDGSCIKIVEGYEPPHLEACTVLIPNDRGARVSEGKVLDRLKKMNHGLLTQNWKIHGCTDQGSRGFLWTFGIDERSMEVLKEVNFSPYYRFGRVDFRVCKKASGGSSETRRDPEVSTYRPRQRVNMSRGRSSFAKDKMDRGFRKF